MRVRHALKSLRRLLYWWVPKVRRLPPLDPGELSDHQLRDIGLRRDWSD